MTYLLDETARREHKRRNAIHSVLLLIGLSLVLAFSATMIWGGAGLVWAAAGVGILMAAVPKVQPEAVMKMYRAQEVDPRLSSQLGRVVALLSERADLPTQPRLYVVPSHTLNAFATGNSKSAAVAVTDGLLRTLSLRELAGVLAHEISHIRNNDLSVMSIADNISRFTQALSTLATILAFLNVISLMVGLRLVSWAAIFVLYLAPMISSLLQLGLSRAREYDADLEAAMLTGDPDGLISALGKLERHTGRFWEDFAFPIPGRHVPEPSLLRSHPHTADRIARLRELHGKPKLPPVVRQEDAVAFPVPRQPLVSPRQHWSGVWY